MSHPSEGILIFVAAVSILLGFGGLAVAAIALTIVKSTQRQYAILSQTLIHPRTARLVDPPVAGPARHTPTENALSCLRTLQAKGKTKDKARRPPIHDSKVPTRGGRAHFLSTADDDIVSSVKETTDAG